MRSLNSETKGVKRQTTVCVYIEHHASVVENIEVRQAEHRVLG